MVQNNLSAGPSDVFKQRPLQRERTLYPQHLQSLSLKMPLPVMMSPKHNYSSDFYHHGLVLPVTRPYINGTI